MISHEVVVSPECQDFSSRAAERTMGGRRDESDTARGAPGYWKLVLGR